MSGDSHRGGGDLDDSDCQLMKDGLTARTLVTCVGGRPVLLAYALLVMMFSMTGDGVSGGDGITDLGTTWYQGGRRTQRGVACASRRRRMACGRCAGWRGREHCYGCKHGVENKKTRFRTGEGPGFVYAGIGHCHKTLSGHGGIGLRGVTVPVWLDGMDAKHKYSTFPRDCMEVKIRMLAAGTLLGCTAYKRTRYRSWLLLIMIYFFVGMIGQASNPGPRADGRSCLEVAIDAAHRRIGERIERDMDDPFGEEDLFADANTEEFDGGWSGGGLPDNWEDPPERPMDVSDESGVLTGLCGAGAVVNEPNCITATGVVPSSPVEPSFIKTNKFEGARGGMNFKKGIEGLGYYRDRGPGDEAPMRPSGESEQMIGPDRARCGAVEISLDELVEHGPSHRRQPLPGVRVVRLFGAIEGEPKRNFASSAAEAEETVVGDETHQCQDRGKQKQRRRKCKKRRSARRDAAVTFLNSVGRDSGRVMDECRVVISDLTGVADDGHTKLGMWALDVVNPNAWRAAIAHADRSSADALMILEARRTPGTQQRAAERAAKKVGWSMTVEPSVPSAGSGPSKGGVAVGVRSHMALAAATISDDDGILATRFRMAWWGGYLAGGMHLGALYLYSGEGLSERNKEILEVVARVLRRIRGPWALGIDAQMSPEALAAYGWLGLVNGHCFAPAKPDGDTGIVYFVTSACLRGTIVGAKALIDGGCRPHYPARLYLRPAPRSTLVRCIMAPKEFERTVQFGPFPQPKRELSIGDDVNKDQFNGKAAEWMRNVEEELCNLCGYDGEQADAHTGRSLGPRFKWFPEVGPKARKQVFTSPQSRAWRVVAAWMSDIATYLMAGRRREVHGRAAAVAWRKLEGGRETLFRGMADVADSSGGDVGAWIDGVDGAKIKHDGDYALAMALHARRAAEKIEGAIDRENAREWREYIKGGAASGLSRQHKFVKVDNGWIPAKVGRAIWKGAFTEEGQHELEEWQRARVHIEGVVGTVQPLGMQDSVDDEAEKWAVIWKEGHPNIVKWPANLGAQLPRPPLARVRAALRKFSTATGVGWEGIGPRLLASLSDEILEGMISILMHAEKVGEWPDIAKLPLVKLLVKPDSTYRAIILFPFLVRVWGRIRRHDVATWERNNDRSWIYGGEGKSAETAAWRQALLAEAAAMSDAHYVQLLLDLVKAFDFVPHDQLVRLASLLDYPLHVLRLSLASYLLPRVVVIGRACSRLVSPMRGIGAGSTLATAEMRAMVLHLTDEVKIRFNAINLVQYVDDTSLAVAATRRILLQQAAGGLKVIGRRFKEMGLQLSDTKNIIIASSRGIADEIIERAREDGITLNLAEQAKSLGSAVGAGNRRATKAAVKRLRCFRRTLPRMWSLRNAGVSVARILRTGGNSRMMFGQSTMGVAPALLKRQRQSAAAGIVAGTSGKCLDLILLLSDAKDSDETDPAFIAHRGPITNWADEIWRGLVPRAVMERLLAKAKMKLAKARRPWGVARGPVTGFLLTAARINWTIHSATNITCDDGTELDLLVDPPAVVSEKVHEAVRRWQMRNVIDYFPTLRGASSICIKPLRDLIHGARKPEGWGSKQRSALMSAVCGGQWPQARLASAGLADDPFCKLCEAYGDSTGEPPRGTLRHRFKCPFVRNGCANIDCKTAAEIDHVMNDGDEMDVFKWTRALARSSVDVIPKRCDESVNWIIEPDLNMRIATIYTDASAVDTRRKELRRVAWAMVAIDASGDAVMAASGYAPPWIHDVVGAEAWAIYMALLHGTPGSNIVTDSLANLEALEHGTAAVTDRKAKLARVRGLVMQALDGQLREGVIDWMPAHTSEGTIGITRKRHGGAVTRVDWLANNLADALAKEQVIGCRVPREIREQLKREEESVERIAIAVGHITAAANAHDGQQGAPRRDSQPREHRGGRQRREERVNGRRRRIATTRPQQLGGHSLHWTGEKWACDVCRCRSTRLANIAGRRCNGSAVVKWAERADKLADSGSWDGPGHRRVANGTLIWCMRCGSYADKWAVGLAAPCRGSPTSGTGMASQLKRLWRGIHPRTARRLDGPPRPEIWDRGINRMLQNSQHDPLGDERWGSAAACRGVAGYDTPQAREQRDGGEAATRASAAKKRLEAVADRVRTRIAARRDEANRVCPHDPQHHDHQSDPIHHQCNPHHLAHQPHRQLEDGRKRERDQIHSQTYDGTAVQGDGEKRRRGGHGGGDGSAGGEDPNEAALRDPAAGTHAGRPSRTRARTREAADGGDGYCHEEGGEHGVTRLPKMARTDVRTLGGDPRDCADDDNPHEQAFKRRRHGDVPEPIDEANASTADAHTEAGVAREANPGGPVTRRRISFKRPEHVLTVAP